MLGLGGKLGDGQQWMSWIHIEDIARLFEFCVETDSVHGPINGVAPEPARNDRFTIELARALGRSVGMPVPASVLKIALGELSSALLASQRVLPKRAESFADQFQYRFPDLTGALRELCEPLQGRTHELLSEQWLPQKPDEIFPFFCDENNLEKITPPTLGFHVLGKNTPEISEGTLIDYKINVHGLPMKWQTRIEQWVPNERFVDTQLKGPYQLWHHTHEFIPFAGGTLMRDRVLYRLPLGILGEGAAGWLVSRDVESIFAFRRKTIYDKFVAPVLEQAKIAP
jgi:ligand-binding SRPBCC domain-containing protein